MPTPRLSEARRVAPAAIIVLAAMLLVVGFGVGGANERSLVSQASGWRGLVGGPRPKVEVAQRQIVVLKTPSLAQRVAANGGLATQHQEHEWTRSAIASQKQLLAEMATHGIQIRVDFSFARVLNGFSAPLDARAVALLERQTDVAGVYPVRVDYPASVSSQLLGNEGRSEEHTSELQSHSGISYAVFCLKKKKNKKKKNTTTIKNTKIKTPK